LLTLVSEIATGKRAIAKFTPFLIGEKFNAALSVN
jgi:hypothetical protein